MLLSMVAALALGPAAAVPETKPVWPVAGKPPVSKQPPHSGGVA
jgi:hypothetical protein